MSATPQSSSSPRPVVRTWPACSPGAGAPSRERSKPILGGSLRPTTDLLLIEDNPGDSDLMCEALREVDAQVVVQVATDAHACRAWLQQLARHRAPRLILCDINLPSVSGFEVLQELRQDERLAGIPMLMWTSSPRGVEQQVAHQAGAEACFTKPSAYEGYLDLARGLLQRCQVA